MKKQAVLLMAAVMTVSLLAGCGNNADNTGDQNGTTGNNTENSTENNTANQTTDQNNTNNADNTTQNGGTTVNHRMGLGIISRMINATNASDKDGSVEIDTVIATVTVDDEDRIVKCRIDMVEHKIPVSNTGAIGAQAQTEYRTKKELGDDYGMKAASGIGKEWYEQVDAFEQYVAGKTVNDINGIKTDEGGYAQDEDLKTSVTISISDFQAAITKAVENAR